MKKALIKDKWMKKLWDRILFGYVLQTPTLVFVILLSFIWQFYDSFYNRFLIEWLFGRQVPGAGFLASLVIALVIGTIGQTRRGWAFVSKCLNISRFTGFIVTIADQWKMFQEHAQAQGVILAPYYRSDSSFWPGVVTNLMPIEGGGYLITVAFGDIPLPKASSLIETDIIYTSLTFSEAVAYMLSGGLALRMFKRRLKRYTLGEYVRTNPSLLRRIEQGH